jgi:formate hydrogenlyase transcriptional activator
MLEAESESLFQKLFESAPDTLVLVGPDGRILRVNAQAKRIFGYAEEELIGQPVEILVPEGFRSIHAGHRGAFAAAPRPREMGSGLELFARRKDGSQVPVDIQLSPLETPRGMLVLSVIRDITERRNAEKAVEQSRRRLQGIMDNSPAVIYLKDLDGRFMTVNQKFEALFGIPRESVIGKTDFDLFPKEVAERFRTNDRDVIQAGKALEFEEVVPQPDGPHTYISVKFPICDAAGSPCNLAGISTDITERKRAQEALLLEVTNTLVTQLDIQQLLAALSASLHQVVRVDSAVLALFDPVTGKLKAQKLTPPFETEPTGQEWEVDPARSPTSWAFTTREPLVLDRMQDDRFDAEILSRWARRGMKSGCFLPIISRGKPLGTLAVLRQQEDAWTETEVSLLRQFALQVGVALENALTFSHVAELKEKVEEEKRYLEEELRTEYEFEDIVGESRPLKVVLKQVETVAPTDATVLIQGETGTGKELIARAIHTLSPRRERTFVRLNCAAIPLGLLESELFGHEKGAFTGAINQKIGRLELAHHGTLYLDEVGDIPLELQPKLLRALQEREFERLGSTRTIPVDVRLIAATNQNLEQMVEEKRFRGDLYYRLKVFPIVVPPLRERREDMSRLIHYFVEKYSRRLNKRIDSVPPEALRALSHWLWPGNIRELENFIERCVILTKGSALNVPINELKMPTEVPSSGSEALEVAERDHILRILRETKGVVGGPEGAAARLGLKRTTLNFKMRKLGISRSDL